MPGSIWSGKVVGVMILITQTPVTDDYKVWMYKNHPVPSLFFLFSVDSIPTTCWTEIKSLQGNVTRFNEKWLNLPWYASLDANFHEQSSLSLLISIQGIKGKSQSPPGKYIQQSLHQADTVHPKIYWIPRCSINPSVYYALEAAKLSLGTITCKAKLKDVARYLLRVDQTKVMNDTLE